MNKILDKLKLKKKELNSPIELSGLYRLENLMTQKSKNNLKIYNQFKENGENNLCKSCHAKLFNKTFKKFIYNRNIINCGDKKCEEFRNDLTLQLIKNECDLTFDNNISNLEEFMNQMKFYDFCFNEKTGCLSCRLNYAFLMRSLKNKKN